MGSGYSNPVPEHQSKILQTGKSGETGIYRSIYSADPVQGDDGLVYALHNKTVLTVYDNFRFAYQPFSLLSFPLLPYFLLFSFLFFSFDYRILINYLSLIYQFICLFSI